MVTATHVEQGVNHVPITFSAVTQDSLDKIGITDASSLAAAVPGLNAGNGIVGKQTFTFSATPIWAIRASVSVMPVHGGRPLGVAHEQADHERHCDTTGQVVVEPALVAD